MSNSLEDNVQILCSRIAPHLRTMLSRSRAGAGDLGVTEDAVGVALDLVRSLLVGAALEVSTQDCPTTWSCPSCEKRIVTRHERAV